MRRLALLLLALLCISAPAWAQMRDPWGSPTFGGTVTMPDNSTWTSSGLVDLGGVQLYKTPSAATSSCSPTSYVAAKACSLIYVNLAPFEQITGTATLGQPTSGYMQNPNFSIFGALNNQSGWNNSTSSNAGRTGVHYMYVRVDNSPNGQGDTGGFFVDAFATGQNAGAASWSANPAGTLYGGQCDLGQAGDYCEFGDNDLDDNGFPGSLAGPVINLKRTKAARSFSLSGTGTTNATTSVGLASVTGIQNHDSISAADIPVNAWVSDIDSGCTNNGQAHCVLMNVAATGSNTETVTVSACCSDDFVGAFRAQLTSGTTVAPDWASSLGVGSWATGLDVSNGTFTTNDAIALSVGQRIDFNATKNGLQAPTPSSSYITYNATNGLLLEGQGATNDAELLNSGGSVVFRVPTGTTNFNVGTVVGGTFVLNKNSSSNTTEIADGSTTGTVTIGGGSNAINIAASAGNLAFPNVTTGTNTDTVCLASGNKMTLQASTCTISSKRFKNLFGKFKGDALAALDHLDVWNFSYKAKNPDPNGNRKTVGIMAEDVAKYMPQCAIYEKDMRTPKSYKPECLIGMLVAGMQEQEKEIRDLPAFAARHEIDELKIAVAVLMLWNVWLTVRVLRRRG